MIYKYSKGPFPEVMGWGGDVGRVCGECIDKIMIFILTELGVDKIRVPQGTLMSVLVYEMFWSSKCCTRCSIKIQVQFSNISTTQ